jgi:hypothetical protein
MDQRFADQGDALGDRRSVPPAAVLLRQRDELTVRAGAGGAAGVDEQHLCEQTGGLGLAGQQAPHQSAQPDRLVAQLGPDQVIPGRRGVALGEHEVDHVQDDVEAPAALGRCGKREPAACGEDGLLGPGDPPGDGGLGQHQAAGDLGRAQPGDRAKGERDLRRRGEGRVAAEEQQHQRVILVDDRYPLLRGWVRRR